MSQIQDNSEPNVWKDIGADIKGLVKTKGFLVVVGGLVLFWLLMVSDVLQGGMLFLVIAVLYFLPAVVARKKPNASSVFVINLFFGWTFVGWVIALAMAVNNPAPAPPARQQPLQQEPVTSAPAAIEATTERKCPYCAEDIRAAAVVCKHCGRDLPPG